MEGKEDTNFLQQYLNHLGLAISGFVRLNGREIDRFEKVQDDFERAKAAGERILVIIDADDDWNERKTEVFEFLLFQHDVKAEQVFVFPNNEIRGSLDTLLLSVIPVEKRPVLNCLDNYSECVEQSGFFGLTGKEKLYAFTNAQLTNAEKRVGEKNHQGQNESMFFEIFGILRLRL